MMRKTEEDIVEEEEEQRIREEVECYLEER